MKIPADGKANFSPTSGYETKKQPKKLWYLLNLKKEKKKSEIKYKVYKNMTLNTVGWKEVRRKDFEDWKKKLLVKKIIKIIILYICLVLWD